MYRNQQNYDSKQEEGYMNFIKNKLHSLDSDYNYLKGEENLVLKTASH